MADLVREPQGVDLQRRRVFLSGDHRTGHDAILGVAGRVGADLIVIGNQGLVRRGRLTSEVPALVLRGARCSVLTVDAATT